MLNRNSVKNFRTDFQSAVQQLEKQYGVSINLGTIRFDSSELRAKMTATTGTPSEKLSKDDFNIGDKVTINHRRCIGKTYTVTRIMRKNILVREEFSGMAYDLKVSPELLSLQKDC